MTCVKTTWKFKGKVWYRKSRCLPTKTVLNTRGTGRAESTQRQLYVFMALLGVSRLRVSADPQDRLKLLAVKLRVVPWKRKVVSVLKEKFVKSAIKFGASVDLDSCCNLYIRLTVFSMLILACGNELKSVMAWNIHMKLTKLAHDVHVYKNTPVFNLVQGLSYDHSKKRLNFLTKF